VEELSEKNFRSTAFDRLHQQPVQLRARSIVRGSILIWQVRGPLSSDLRLNAGKVGARGCNPTSKEICFVWIMLSREVEER